MVCPKWSGFPRQKTCCQSNSETTSRVCSHSHEDLRSSYHLLATCSSGFGWANNRRQLSVRGRLDHLRLALAHFSLEHAHSNFCATAMRASGLCWTRCALPSPQVVSRPAVTQRHDTTVFTGQSLAQALVPGAAGSASVATDTRSKMTRVGMLARSERCCRSSCSDSTRERFLRNR